MAGTKNKHHVSFWFWFFALFILAIPCVGFIMNIVWAFTGDNESRKNYFRALLVWSLLLAGVSFTLGLLGFWPLILRQLEHWLGQRK